MGLLGFLKGKEEKVLAAPVKGECIPIGQVADSTFAEEILGKGIAIKPEEGRFYAPADGMISTVFPTGHAVGLTTEDGVEILIHIGLDTVALKGMFFSVQVKEGQQVEKGDLLVEAELDKISSAGYDTVTPVVICNSSELTKVECKTEGKVAAGDKVIVYAK